MQFSVLEWFMAIIALLIIVSLFYFFGRTYLYKLMNTAIIYAEKNFATNPQRLDGAIDWIVKRIPAALRPFISRRWIQKAIQSAFDGIKQYTKIDKQD